MAFAGVMILIGLVALGICIDHGLVAIAHMWRLIEMERNKR